MPPRIALTSGEPAGIGPDLALAVAASAIGCELVCLADRELLAERASGLGLTVALRPYEGGPCPHVPGSLTVEHHPLACPARVGRRKFNETQEMKRLHAMEAIRASRADEDTQLWLQRLRDDAYVRILAG